VIAIIPVEGIGEVADGDDVAALVCAGAALLDGDVVVVAQKIVSKAEGRLVRVDPAQREAERGRLIREEATEVLARRGDVVIARTRHGFVCASAGVDASNVPLDALALLPLDPDASAARIRDGIRTQAGVEVGVIVADTFGRPWRIGQTNVAIGVAGLDPVRDERGRTDAYGMTLEATVVAVADELAGAAELVMGKADRVPVAVVRGHRLGHGGGTARDLIRPSEEDLFPRGIMDP